MWEKIANLILRYKYYILALIVLFTGLMAYNASKVELAYNMQKLVPHNDQDLIDYEKFKQEFGDDGNKLIIGFQSDKIFTKKLFNDLFVFSNQVDKINGVYDVLSLPKIYNLEKDDSLRKFQISPIQSGLVSQSELDSLKDIILSLKFYKDLIYNETTDANLIVVSLDKDKLDSKYRTKIIDSIYHLAEKFGTDNQLELHYSGLPYVRHILSTKVKDELGFFTFLALSVTAILFWIFFRSFANLGIALLIVSLAVIWSVGWLGWLDYKITLLTGLIPAIMIVIGIPNSIYLINKYHEEYSKHNNKIKALQRVVSRVGSATVLTNLTTAIGFGVFYFTDTLPLKQFGVAAFLSVMSIFVISLTLIPIFFSMLKAPSVKQTKHLENRHVKKMVEWIHFMVFNKKRRIYYFTILLIIISIIGFFKLKPLVYMVDDIPHQDKLYKDLMFMQDNFKGVMPFEIVIDTREVDGLKNPITLQKIYKLQKKLENQEDFSRAISIVEVIKFANQSYNNGDENYYRLPNNLDLAEIATYLPERTKNKSILKSMVDADFRKARVSIQMKDVGSVKMEEVTNDVSEIIKEIFPEEDYDVKITGTSIIFLKGNKFLVNSLVQSVIFAFLIIAFLMGMLFTSFKMVIVSLIPNMIPLLITCGLMGHFGVPLKPSTILVYSIAFGIAVDDTIHFLTKFRHELKRSKRSVPEVLSITIKEMGQSMIYTSVVLFFGFIIFTFSNFQGTVALGFLTSATLLVALFSNLFVLPALILSFEKGLNPKAELEDAIIESDEFKD
ncbi:MAG: MMPL family transporter [Bacteroidota bacterium]|nr:MMPL family transporter [Bacteroidota bacterium]